MCRSDNRGHGDVSPGDTGTFLLSRFQRDRRNVPVSPGETSPCPYALFFLYEVNIPASRIPIRIQRKGSAVILYLGA